MMSTIVARLYPLWLPCSRVPPRGTQVGVVWDKDAAVPLECAACLSLRTRRRGYRTRSERAAPASIAEICDLCVM